MKLKTRSRHQEGGLLLALLVVVLAVVIIGLVVYSILKALQRLPLRNINPDDVAMSMIATAEAEIDPVTLPISGTLSDGSYYVQLSTNEIPHVRIERSTNLVHWQEMAVLPLPRAPYWIDTNPPPHCGFYRMVPAP